MDDFYIFLAAIVVLFILWWSLGGPSRSESQEGKFIRQPDGIEELEIYDEKIIDNERLRNRLR